MENSEFKNLWKTMVDEEVRHYPEAELNAMVLKSARKSMRKLYPGWKFKVAISTMVVGYMLWAIFSNTGNIWLIATNTFILALVLASLIVAYLSKRKMDKYQSDTSVKEWLKFRIDELDRGIRILKKYRIYIDVGTLMLAAGIIAAYNYILYGFVININVAAAIAVCLFVLVIMRILWKDRNSEVRDYLQSLYEQIEL